jgi:hypothetical protein
MITMVAKEEAHTNADDEDSPAPVGTTPLTNAENPTTSKQVALFARYSKTPFTCH